MNDFASIENSSGLLKKNYDPTDEQLEALRRRQQTMAQRVKNQSVDPKEDKDSA